MTETIPKLSSFSLVQRYSTNPEAFLTIGRVLLLQKRMLYRILTLRNISLVPVVNLASNNSSFFSNANGIMPFLALVLNNCSIGFS